MSNARAAARSTSEALSIQAVHDRYLAAWAACDPALIASLHSEGSSFWMHDGTARVFGRGPIEKHFAGIFARYPGFSFDVYRTLIGDRHWVLDWAMKAELTGKGGRKVEIRIDMLDIVDINDAGEVVRKDTFYDASQAQAAMAKLSEG